MDAGTGRKVAAWAGIVLMFFPVGLFYFLTGLLAPPYAVVGLGIVWVGIVVAAFLIRNSRPWLTLAMPFLAFGLWMLVLFLGDIYLGWTA